MDRPSLKADRVRMPDEDLSQAVYGDDRFSSPSSTLCPDCSKNTLLISGKDGDPLELSFGQKGRAGNIKTHIRLCPYCEKIVITDNDFFTRARNLVDSLSSYPKEEP